MREVRETEMKMIPRMGFLLGDGAVERVHTLCATQTVMETSSLYILRSVSQESILGSTLMSMSCLHELPTKQWGPK